jgi:alkaline phosphatase D
MPRTIDRRSFLGYAGTGALILGGVAVDPAAAKKRRTRRKGLAVAREGTFPQGVAAGTPGENGISLWTRMEGQGGDFKLRVEVAKDPKFRKVISNHTKTVRASKDHCLETRVAGKALKPGHEYYYRFETRTGSSPVGRFQTMPAAGSRQPVKIVFFSCQDWQAGYYGAHRAIAAEDADLVVGLGDYIYERNFYEGPRKDTLGANHDGEVQTLDEYRQKYRMYKADPNLRAMHAQHSYVGIWDDHEVEDNWAGANPGAETMQVRVPFLQRRSNGFRAFYEYMPFEPLSGKPSVGSDLYRRMRVGANAELFLLDTRQYRDDQPCDDQLFVPCAGAESDTRRFIGERQKSWLKQYLRSSGATWKLIGNQVMIMALDTISGAPINKDSWDGYGAERRDLLGYVRDQAIKNVSFLTGDIHTFFAGDVGVNGRGPDSVATEFVGGSLTSLGIPETIASTTGVPLTTEQYAAVTSNLPLLNPHLKYTQQTARGYGVAEVTQDRMEVTFKAVNALDPNATARTIGRFAVASGSPRVQVL